MFKINKLLIASVFWVALLSCNQGDNKNKFRFAFVTVNDSLYKPNDDYKQIIDVWKDYYQKCTNEKLFENAFYLYLQNKVYIGSINNQNELIVNRGTTILDTSNYKNLFNLLENVSSSNCGDTINLLNHLKEDFYNEIIDALNATSEYRNLINDTDTGQMKIKLGAVSNNRLRVDSLIELLDKTKDSSLLHFKDLLLKPENVILGQTIDLFGFSAEFPLKSKLSEQEEKQFEKEVFFNLSTQNDKGSIRLVSNNILRIQINKRYTVLGRFLKLQVN